MVFDGWGLRDYHHLNEYVAGIFSLVTNLLLIKLISSERNDVLKSYSKVLLMNCIVDFLFTLACMLAELQMGMYDGYYIFVVSGVLETFPIAYQYVVCWFWIFMRAFAIMVIPVMFNYRWSMVCRGSQIPLHQFCLLLLIPSGLAAFETTFLTFGQLANEPVRVGLCQRLLNDTMWLERVTVPGFNFPRNCIAAYSVSRSTNPQHPQTLCALFGTRTMVFVICAILTDTFTYAAIAAFGLAILRGLQRSRGSLSAKTVRMQRQMNRILAVQAITPLFNATIPVAIIMGALFLKINVRGMGVVVSMMLSWIPITNPLSTMLLVSAYRRRLVLCLCLLPKRVVERIGITPVFTAIAPTRAGATNVARERTMPPLENMEMF